MMKSLKLFTMVFCLSLAMASCGDDEPCNGGCPDGFSCVNDNCVEDNNDPCLGVTCDPGFSCVNGNCVEDAVQTEVISGAITSNATWTSDKVYELANKVVVDNGATLTIEAGTIIKGREGTGSLATALIIARGSKIEACGSADKPIIFTSTLDNIEPGQIAGTNLSETNNELWGGLIILGNAPISAKDGDTQTQIEGIPADDTFGLYGGNDPADDSGSLCYVSIRHGGALIGDDNEINGLTLGGVGTGTSINHVEVVANLDDGIECFGGTVNLDNVIVTYQGDDAIDLDMNYSGTIDNFIIIHGGSDTDEALEIDGPENSTYTDGKFTLSNGMCVALDTEKTTAADLKSKAQGTINSVTWVGYDALIKVRANFDTEANCAEKSDAYTNLVAGDLLISNSEVVSGTAALGDFAFAYIDNKADDANQQQACLDANEANYETVIDAMISDNGNTVNTGNPTSSVDMSQFTGWTWSDARGFLSF